MLGVGGGETQTKKLSLAIYSYKFCLATKADTFYKVKY